MYNVYLRLGKQWQVRILEFRSQSAPNYSYCKLIFQGGVCVCVCVCVCVLFLVQLNVYLLISCMCQARIISVIRADGKNMALPLTKKRTLPAWMIRMSRAGTPMIKKKPVSIRVEAPAKRAGVASKGFLFCCCSFCFQIFFLNQPKENKYNDSGAP